MIYLDLFKKYILESSDEWTTLNSKEIVKKLLNNYFNNDVSLVECHYNKLDAEFLHHQIMPIFYKQHTIIS